MSTKKWVLVILLVSFIIFVIQTVSATRYENIIISADADSYGDAKEVYADASFGNDMGSYARIGCNEGTGWPSKGKFHDAGCYFFSVENDDCDYDDSDSYGYAIFHSGKLTSYDYSTYSDYLTYWTLGDDSAFLNMLQGGHIRISTGQGLCTNDLYWHVCTSDVARSGEKKGIVAWGVNGELYECVLNGAQSTWKLLGRDYDQDGYTQDVDCVDLWAENQEAGLECPSLSFEERVGLTLEEIRSQARSMCEEDPIKYAGCAICINPGAPEVCGDDINNDCGGSTDPEEKEDWNNLEGETYDDCDKNQESCTQQPGDKYQKLVVESQEGCEEKVDADCKTKEVAACKADPEQADDCEAKAIQKCTTSCQPPEFKAGNVYNEYFSWIQTGDTEKEGHCCGYEGIKDLGAIETGEDANDYICLNQQLIGFEGSWNDISPKIGEEEACQEDWCWLKAISNAKFKIITIRNATTEPYDVVSNNYEWKECREGKDATFPWPDVPPDDMGGLTFDEIKEKSNRFRCYDEGNRWSWAECAGSEQVPEEAPKEGEPKDGEEKTQGKGVERWNIGIKGRYPGEALYTLPLDTGDGNIKEERYGKSIDIKANYYKKYYPDNFLDFSGYDYFNFMLVFVDESNNKVSAESIDKPADVVLTIRGPKPQGENVKKEEKAGVILFQRHVLGDVINNPFFSEQNWMHVKVPIPENLRGVNSIMIEVQPATNHIGVKNVYLSRKLQMFQTTPLCSGKDFAGENNWLTDIDQGNEGTEVIGDELCQKLYGDNAWLGKDADLDEDAYSSNCCGDDKEEYYAGRSKEQVSEIAEGTPEKRYGCWNSEVVASGDKVMNVEFEVKYNEKEHNITFNDINLSPPVGVRYYVSQKEGSDNSPFEANLPQCLNPISLKIGETFKELCHFKLADLPEAVQEETSVWFAYPYESQSDYVETNFYDLTTLQKIGSSEIAGKEDEPLLEGVLYLPKKIAGNLWNRDLAIVVTLKEGVYFPLDENSLMPISTPKSASKTYSCTKEACYFPLPGEPPYIITNPHPDLYELYFISKDDKGNEKETLITETNKEFNELGNIVARKVAQQVIFHNEGVEKEPFSGFYGCEAASFLKESIPESFAKYFYEKTYCSVVGNNFCSYFSSPKAAEGKYTLINSWSNEPITKIGYDQKIDAPAKDENISSFYEHAELKLKDPVETLGPDKRTNFTAVLPARNFISNAEFIKDGTEIPRWEIFSKEGVPVKDEWNYLKDKSQPPLTLKNAGEILRTEKIAVPKNATLHYSHQGSCTPKVILIDKDGKFPQYAEVKYPEIKTGQASYLILEYVYPCAVEQPMLQMIDDKGPAEYKYVSQHSVLSNFDSRAGASCCPSNFCWNGYACVESMVEQTSIVEYINAGRAYRCVNGNWKLSPLQWDWNGMKWGFCPQEGQCFVLASGKEEYAAKDFYLGNYPNCINNTSYIFDHYCESGNWTSRTKFVASKLVEAAEDGDFVLYCSPYQEAFLDYKNQVNYVGGPETAEKSTLPKTPLEKVGKEQVNVCYKDILAGEGKELVSVEEDTCVNNICVLQFKEGKEYNTAFATSLNRPIDKENSFLISLGIPQNKVSQLCKGEKGKFTKCDLSKEKLPGDLYYSEDLNAVIYARDGLEITPGISEKLLDWLKGLFGLETKITKELKFIKEAQNYKDVYVLKNGEKKVRAVKEVLPQKETLIAEYENFKTPLCSYVQNIKRPPELQQELLPEVLGETELSCTANETMQRVEMIAGLDFFWPQLTGKLRMS